MRIIDNQDYNAKNMIEALLMRSQLNFKNVQEIVDDIIENVRNKKDGAVLEYTRKFDQAVLTPQTLKVTDNEIQEAYNTLDENFISILQRAADRIRLFHEKQKRNSWIAPDEKGTILGQMVRPMESVGVYVPGGKAAYPSSVLMNVIPAQVAGVNRIVMVTPPQNDGSVNPGVLVAAKIAGVTEIYKVGGAQAVAALAFGTETIPKVDKIVGPGNIFVTLAKRTVFGHVSIDSIAGPSEILVVADDSANPVFVAADLLSQAEHDELASAILVTTSAEVAYAVKDELIRQTEKLSRKEIITKSLKDFGVIIIVNTIEEAIEISNQIAPEHLEVCTREALSLLPKIKNAGAIFLGHYSPEPLGDYMAGPNHVLPTSGTAKFFSPLNVEDFMKKSSVIFFPEEALKELSEDIITFAEAEALTAHANSVRVRFEND
ncbi:histidinol dehydrogenase [Defluviitalea saccharophila]|uniref:histidinol dehydrogenase n=1 Tax=Defluviitalea saccharophila TaxID=879970 RepID=UPI0016ACB3A8|nr:histidinol dehydrogenase [Candidatus Epulonipiscium sp.]